MAMDELPDAPDPANDAPQVFSQKGASMVLAIKNLIPQMNGEIASLNTLFAGGAYSFLYSFDTGTTNADPGNGRLRLGSTPQNAATVLRIDLLDSAGSSIGSLFDAIGAGTSVLKGAIKIVKAQDPTKWLLFDVMAVAAASGYRNFTLVPRGGSAASPFANNDPVMIYLDRAGDRGNGSLALQYLDGMTISSAALNIDYLNIFTSEFDKYIIELTGITGSTSDALHLRGAVAGVVTTASGYYGPSVDGASMTSATQFAFGNVSTSVAFGSNYTLELRNINSSSGQKGFGVRGAGSTISSSVIREGFCGVNGVFSGFRLATATGGVTITSGSIAIYGVRKTNL